VSAARTPTAPPSINGAFTTRRVRWIVRALCLVVATVAMLLAPRGWDWGWLLPSLSPFLALASLIATATFQRAAALGLALNRR